MSGSQGNGEAAGGEAPPLPSEAEFIHDWNAVERFGQVVRTAFTTFDETLRDGIQSPSVTDPRIEDKLRIVHLLDELGIDHVNIGLPGAGQRAVEDVTRLLTEIRDSKLRIRPAAAA